MQAFKANLAASHQRVRELETANVRVQDLQIGLILKELWILAFQSVDLLDSKSQLAHRLVHAIPASWRARIRNRLSTSMRQVLSDFRPDLAVISQGDNFDGLQLAAACRDTGIPDVLLAQKATDERWPRNAVRAQMREIFGSAVRSFSCRNTT